MTGALLLAGIVVWALGAALDLTAGADRTWARVVPYGAGTLGAALVTAAGVRMVFRHAHTVDLGSTLGMGETSLRFDPLAGLFLTLTAGLGVFVSLCMASWVRPTGRVRGHGTAAGYLLLLGSVATVIVAGDAFTFLFAWEGITFAFFVLTSVTRRSQAQTTRSWTTVGMGKAGGAALLLGFLLLAAHSHSLQLVQWTHVPPGAVHSAAFVLIVVGFGAKVGLMPFQVWLPVGYPSAPGPARAAMAGIAANAGFYGLWRFFALLGPPPEWLVVVVLVLGGVTALVGIVFAAVQNHLDRVIAYSSIENAGVILVGYGVALAGAASHHVDLVAIGLLAASLQVLAHGVAKSGLFASAAFFETDHGTDEIELLRGIGRQHHTSATAFGIASLTLAGLPPTIGFVSEWMILESLMQEFRVGGLAIRLAMAGAGALVALTTGFAALCFVRLIGLMVLSRDHRGRPDPQTVHDGAVAGRSGMALLAGLCLALAAAAPWVVRFIANGLAPAVPTTAVAGALKEPWVLQPVYSNFSILSPSWMYITMPVGLVVVFLAAWALSGGRLLRIRRVPAWRSATGGVNGLDHYSAFGYANVLRHVLSNVLEASRSTVPVDSVDTGPGSTEAGARGPDGRSVDDGSPAGPGTPSAAPSARPDGPQTEVSVRIVEPVEAYLYRPARIAWLALARQAKRLQSGRLDAYVAYMLIAFLVLLGLVALLK